MGDSKDKGAPLREDKFTWKEGDIVWIKKPPMPKPAAKTSAKKASKKKTEK
jgi:hypothetical protein